MQRNDHALKTLRTSLVGAVPLIVVENNAWHASSPFREDSPPLVWLSTTACAIAAPWPISSNRAKIRIAHPLLPFRPNRWKTKSSGCLVSLQPRQSLPCSRTKGINSVAGYRTLAAILDGRELNLPIWIRNQDPGRLFPDDESFSGRLLDSSILSGALLCDGTGDLISVENAGDLDRNRGLSYNILQGARARISKTEFVACPSCGRTLFDLQSTTHRVKEATGHLKGVTIAVMGCIVNGPGEMADADFGSLIGPGKIDLSAGKDRVKSSIRENEAVDRLVDLIQEEGKWIDP